MKYYITSIQINSSIACHQFLRKQMFFLQLICTTMQVDLKTLPSIYSLYRTVSEKYLLDFSQKFVNKRVDGYKSFQRRLKFLQDNLGTETHSFRGEIQEKLEQLFPEKEPQTSHSKSAHCNFKPFQLIPLKKVEIKTPPKKKNEVICSKKQNIPHTELKVEVKNQEIQHPFLSKLNISKNKSLLFFKQSSIKKQMLYNKIVQKQRKISENLLKKYQNKCKLEKHEQPKLDTFRFRENFNCKSPNYIVISSESQKQENPIKQIEQISISSTESQQVQKKQKEIKKKFQSLENFESEFERQKNQQNLRELLKNSKLNLTSLNELQIVKKEGKNLIRMKVQKYKQYNMKNVYQRLQQIITTQQQ